MKMASRKAISEECHGQDSPYFVGWQEYEKDPYHPIANPSGIIQMGLAENQLANERRSLVVAPQTDMFEMMDHLNQLSFDIVEAWLEKNPDILGLKKDGLSMFKELALFQDYHGYPSFKHALVKFMAKIRGNRVNFDSKKLVLTAGATSANEILMFCLADPGEVFLLPTPYYPAFDRDLKWRTGVKIVPIHCSSSNGFRITPSALQQAYERAISLNLKVKGVLVTNPSNPLGISLSKTELNLLLDFAIDKKVHIISDEIYSGTVFDSPTFISIMEVAKEKNIEEEEEARLWSRIHIVYSLSKDLGLPGFRVGMIYSNNQVVVEAATKMSSFGLVSSQTQYLLANLLSDDDFTEEYMKETQRRLKKRREMLVSGLRKAGVRCLKSNAGLFCWVDMRNLLSSDSFEAEKELWKKILKVVGLNISPGSSCHCSEPGWFRVCFADMSENTLQVAMQRLKVFADSTAASERSELCRRWVSQLSSSCDWEAGIYF